jgi:hypothetical protein
MPTSRTLFASILVFVLLLVGLAAVYAPSRPTWLGGRPSLAAADELTYVSDLDFWQRTPRERIVVANARFDLDHDLNAVPLQVGPWTGKDAPETNQEVMILLEPEQYVQRLYQDTDGHFVWLTMVGGRNSQPFHAPDICYDADGWQYNLGSHATSLEEGGEIYGLYLDATKHVEGEAVPWEHVVYYFYLFPDDARDQNDGIVLFKLTAPKYGSVEETLALLEGFTRKFFSVASTPGSAPAPTVEAPTALLAPSKRSSDRGG